MRIGRITPSELASVTARLHGHPLGLYRDGERSRQKPARKPFGSLAPARALPPVPQPVVVPYLALSARAKSAPSPRHKPSPASSAFRFQCPVPRGLYLGKTESRATSPPPALAQSVPFGALEKPQRERNLRSPNEISPTLVRPSRPICGGGRSAATCPSTLLRERSPAPGPLGGLHRLGTFSGWPRETPHEKWPSATGSMTVRRVAQRRPILRSVLHKLIPVWAEPS